MKKLFPLLIALFAAITANAQIFYKITSPKSGNVSYIFGTHHLAPLSTFTDMPEAVAAFNSSQQIIGEMDMLQDQNILAAKLTPYMLTPADSTLSKLISPEKYEIVKKEFNKWKPMDVMTLEMFEPMKPLVVSSMIAIGILTEDMPDYNPAEQLDSYFQQEAQKAGKNIVALETAERQGECLYCSLPLSVQAESLVEMAENPEKTLQQSSELNKMYLTHNIEGLYNLTKEDDGEESSFNIAILDNRNKEWVKVLPQYINDTNNFIAVGALHLPGEKGILEQLKKLGFIVEAIK